MSKARVLTVLKAAERSRRIRTEEREAALAICTDLLTVQCRARRFGLKIFFHTNGRFSILISIFRFFSKQTKKYQGKIQISIIFIEIIKTNMNTK